METRMKGIQVWELPTGRPLARFETGWVRQLAFTPDGQRLITVGPEGMRVWEIATGQEIWRHANVERLHDYTDVGSFASSLTVAPDGRTMATGHPDTTILIWDLLPAPRGERPHVGPLTAAEKDRAWSDLAGADARRAYTAMGDLAVAPAQAVALLRERLRPVAAVSPELLSRLLADLDSGAYKQRTPAAQQLVELDELAEQALRGALKRRPSLEQRQRIEQILAAPGLVRSPATLRGLRAIQVLERVGTPEARQTLQVLAKGPAEARVTRAAKGSLERMAKQGASP